MKKVASILCCMVLLCTMMPVFTPVSASVVSNDLFEGYTATVVSKNGNFEGVTETTLKNSGWTLPEASLVSNSTDAYEGSAYISISQGESAKFSATDLPDNVFVLQGYYKCEESDKAAGTMLFMQEDDVSRYSNYNGTLLYKTEWTRFGMALNANKTKSGAVSFEIRNTGEVTYHFDNLELIRLDNADTRNLVSNSSFEFDDVDNDENAQHHYSSWYNNGTARLVDDAHKGTKAMQVLGGNIYTYAFLPDVNSNRTKYEISAWIKWENGSSFAAGDSSLTAPRIGVESYAGNTRVAAKDYHFTVESGIKSNDWCHVRLVMDSESTPETLSYFRIFLFAGSGATIWDDVCIKPVETNMYVLNGMYEVQEEMELNAVGSYALSAQYVGDEGEKDGKAFFARYRKRIDGKLQLVDISAGALKADGRTTLLHLEGVDSSDDNMVIRAFMWDSSHNPIDDFVLGEKEFSEDTTPIIKNGSFEDVQNGVPAGITFSHPVGGANISLVTDEVYSGDYALKLNTSSNDVYFDFNLSDLFYGTTYTLSFMYKGTVTSDVTAGNRENVSGVTAFTRYHADTDSSVFYNREFYAPSSYSSDEWTRFTYTFRLLEGSNLLVRPALRSRNSEIYIDDVKLEVAKDSPVARVVTDQVFYYSDRTGNGQADIILSPHFAGRGYTVNVRLVQGVIKSKEEKGLTFGADNKIEFTYDLALLRLKAREYRIIVNIFDADGSIVQTISQSIYKYDRPSTVSADGTFTDINGKVINPMFAYHIGYDDFKEAASVGINVVQYSPPSDVNVCLAQLDEMYEMGVYAAIVSYWGMYPAGHSVNYERVSAYINQIKHHPAIFCYMVMDEPFLNNPEAHDDLRKSYKMLRDADPDRPAYICEGFPAFMKEVGKYCDIMAPDPYPTGVRGDMATYVTDMVSYANAYVDAKKPLITILQAFTQSGRRPTALELHSMMYQSFMTGSDAAGFYTWEPDDPNIDTKISEGDYWPMLQSFYANEHAIVYKYYGQKQGEKFSESKTASGNVWYESWKDGDNLYMVIENRSSGSETTATIPLVSSDGKTMVTATDISIIGFGNNGAIITEKYADKFDIKLNPSAAALICIRTNSTSSTNEGEYTVSTGGDFEGYTPAALKNMGWTINETGLANNSAEAHGGIGYLKLAPGESVTFATKSFAGYRYRLEGYYKHGSDAETASVQLFMHENDVSKFTNYNSALVYSEDWTKFGMIMNACRTVTGEVGFSVVNNSGATLYLDDLKLIRITDGDTENLIANTGFEYDDADTETTIQHHYASWFNNGNLRLIEETDGNKALQVVSGNAYTWTPLPNANPNGQKYEITARIKWENGKAFAEGNGEVTAPRIGVESYAGSNRVAAKDYYLTVDGGVSGSDWCNVRILLDSESTPAGFDQFRIFLCPGTGATLWDDISVKPLK